MASKQKSQIYELGPCPICGRSMRKGPSVDRHHWTPKSQGGEDWAWLHRLCHKKIHSLFTERFLAEYLNTAEKLLHEKEIQNFVKWVRKQPIEANSRMKKPRLGKRSR